MNKSIEPEEHKEDNLSQFQGLYSNYQFLNEKLASELKIASDHHGITGNFREKEWLSFFRGIIPRKFSLAQDVKIIDSEKKVSKEVDIAVFDEQYMPYVFVYKDIKYIPIEAVAVAIQCKSKEYDYDSVCEWSTSIKQLTTQNTGIARIATGYTIGFTSFTQVRTRPIMILATMAQFVKDKTIEDKATDLSEYYDFIILGKKQQDGKYSFEVKLNNEEKSLGWWANSLNECERAADQEDVGLSIQSVTENVLLEKKISDNYSYLNFESTKSADGKNTTVYLTNKLKDLRVDGNSFLTLNFQLNQLLMLINNPMFFPHFAYANAFKPINSDEQLETGKTKETHAVLATSTELGGI